MSEKKRRSRRAEPAPALTQDPRTVLLRCLLSQEPPWVRDEATPLPECEPKVLSSAPSNDLEGPTVPPGGTVKVGVRDLDQKFIRGPLPLAWFARAAQLPGKAISVGLALFYVSGLNRAATVRLSRRTATRLGVGRGGLRASLKRLEAAALVSVERRAGRSPLVTLLLAVDPQGTGNDIERTDAQSSRRG